MSKPNSKSKTYVVLALSGIVFLLAITSLYTQINTNTESEDTVSEISSNSEVTLKTESNIPEESETEVSKISNGLILLIHYQSIRETAEEFGDTSSGFLRTYPPTEPIEEISEATPETIIANGVNALSILGPSDQDVVYLWKDLTRYFSRMNYNQIENLLQVMDEEAEIKNLNGDSLIFFTEQRQQIQELSDKAKEKEPSEQIKQLVLNNLNKYNSDLQRQKSNLQSLNSIKDYNIIHDNMINYIISLQDSIREFSLYLTTSDFEHLDQTMLYAENAGKLQYSIDEIIKTLDTAEP